MKKFTLLLMVSFVMFSAFAPALGKNISNQKPKLVVFLIADQFLPVYLTKCFDKFQANGLRQFLDNGAVLTSCRYSGSTNQTACNLAVITSGAYPWATGIVGNEWYDRRKQKIITAGISGDANDLDEANSHYDGFYGTTLGDELKVASNGHSQILTISMNKANSLLLAGRGGGTAFWWDCHNGTFTGMFGQQNKYPGWLNSFNNLHYSEKYVGKNWWSADSDVSSQSNTADESFYTKFMCTPWANQMIMDFAKEAVQKELLGQRDSTDVLNLDFSSFELVGKNYGAYSPEAFELVTRFDRSLSDLFQFLDSKIGLANCLIVFTAGHGSMASPETLKAQGIESGITPAKSLRAQLNTLLASRLGKANWVEEFVPPNVYLNLAAIDHSNYKQPDIEKLAAKLSRSINGVAEAYTAGQFFMQQVPIGPIVGAIEKSYFWGRSGELYIIPKPGYAFTSDSGGTICGSPYNYDNQVPLLFYGSAIKSGNFADASNPADIVATMANILGITPPSLCEGRVLSEILNWTESAKYVKSNK